MTNNNVQVTYAGQQVQNTITSLEVAEMVGRNHKDVMRDIRKIKEDLDALNVAPISYFAESAYKDKINRNKPMYSLTKQGCELYGNRMTGIEGTAFAIKYIERFNQMEQVIENKLPSDPLELALTAALETRKEVAEIRQDVNLLKDSMTIDNTQQKQLQAIVNRKVLDAAGGKKSVAYVAMARKLYPNAWRELKSHFCIPRYQEVRKKDFEEAKQLLEFWEPSASLKLEIAAYNRQLSADELATGWEERDTKTYQQGGENIAN